MLHVIGEIFHPFTGKMGSSTTGRGKGAEISSPETHDYVMIERLAWWNLAKGVESDASSTSCEATALNVVLRRFARTQFLHQRSELDVSKGGLTPA